MNCCVKLLILTVVLPLHFSSGFYNPEYFQVPAFSPNLRNYLKNFGLDNPTCNIDQFDEQFENINRRLDYAINTNNARLGKISSQVTNQENQLEKQAAQLDDLLKKVEKVLYILGTATTTPEPQTTTTKPSTTPKPTTKPSTTPKPTTKPSTTPKPTTKPSTTPKPTTKPSTTPKPTTKPSTTPKPTTTPEPTTTFSETTAQEQTTSSETSETTTLQVITGPREIFNPTDQFFTKIDAEQYQKSASKIPDFYYYKYDGHTYGDDLNDDYLKFYGYPPGYEYENLEYVILDGANDLFDIGNQILFYEGGRQLTSKYVDYNITEYNGKIGWGTIANYPFLAVMWTNNTNDEVNDLTISVNGDSGHYIRDEWTDQFTVLGFQVEYSVYQITSEDPRPSLCEVYFTVHLEEENAEDSSSVLKHSGDYRRDTKYDYTGRGNVIVGYTFYSKYPPLATAENTKITRDEVQAALRDQVISLLPTYFDPETLSNRGTTSKPTLVEEETPEPTIDV